ncbi:MAG TPA: flagellar hook-basal body complex protein FliE [Rhodopila sp.]|nr:flagellar hook-basal body complex protein FliE [Rhodopila sp.]
MTPVASIIPFSHVTSAYGSSSPTGSTGAGDTVDFSSLVGNAARSALQSLHQAEKTTAAGVAGKTDVQSVVEALSNAEVTMQSVVAVRDKVLGAYNDIMHMSV